MRDSEINEVLAKLYLRLNGYFTTGLIMHSPEWGQTRTEIDCLAIRHPHHRQSERIVDSAEFLSITEGEVDIILCEVKSEPQNLMFNKPLRTDLEAVRAALRWAGVFNEDIVCKVSERLQPLLQENVPICDARDGVIEGMYRVRLLLCCPPLFESSSSKWCLAGEEIFRYVHECFNPQERRQSCSTRYNFQQWGIPFTPLVTYLKNNHVKNASDLAELYRNLGAK